MLIAGSGRRPPRRAAAAQIAGVAKVLHADAEQFGHGLAENIAAQVLAIAKDYSHILFPATAAGKNVAPRVAAKLDVGQISDITKVDLARHLRAADLRRQRDRHRAEPRRDQGHHGAHDRLRSGGGDRRLGAGRDRCSRSPTPASRRSSAARSRRTTGPS